MRTMLHLTFIALFFAPTGVKAIDGIILSIGTGMNDSLIQIEDISGADQLSIGVFWESEIDYQSDIFGYGELEYELYYSEISFNETIKNVSFRPFFNFWDSAEKKRDWYWQFGVGLSYFDEKNLLPIEFSSNAQFATIFGLGLEVDEKGRNRLTLRYNHYSNAYIKRPNPGLDTISLDWHLRF